jgi:hypothetical protein
VTSRIFKNWSFFRVLRLLMGLLILAQAIVSRDFLFGLAGVLFTLMPLLNQGCCSSQSQCYINTNNKSSRKEIKYEEVD